MDATKRFSDKVENYIKYRPDYPSGTIKYLKDIKVLKSESVAADIGSGTGILTRLLLNDCSKVYAVEPNDAMRKAAENTLNNFDNFISINGTAEDTTLRNNSVDIITAAQAFHWFDINKTKAEFSRIIKPAGYVVIIWNEWDGIKNEFIKEYEQVLNKYGTDYNNVKRQKVTEDVLHNFIDINFSSFKLTNYQEFDLKGLMGRFLSASYAPAEGDKNYDKAMKDLKRIFQRYCNNGIIRFEYETVIYSGCLNK